MRGLVISLILLIFIFPVNVVSDESEIEIRGGGAVIFEQATAVWCDVCAQHEEWLTPMVESNGERLIRVNLHSSIDDPLGNEASNYRRAWLGHFDNDPTPKYHFDGVGEITPSFNRGELQRSLLDAESDRMEHEVLEVSLSFDSSTVFVQSRIDDPILVNSTSMTLMVLENSAYISPENAANGLTNSHSVLRSIISVSTNNSIEYPTSWASVDGQFSDKIIANFSFEWPNELDANSTTIVVIHEKTDGNGDRTTLSALSWSGQTLTDENRYSLWIPLIGIGALIGTIVFYSKEN